VEYLRNNFRPLQELGGRLVYKSAVEDAWKSDVTDVLGADGAHGTEASRGTPLPSTSPHTHTRAHTHARA